MRRSGLISRILLPILSASAAQSLYSPEPQAAGTPWDFRSSFLKGTVCVNSSNPSLKGTVYVISRNPSFKSYMTYLFVPFKPMSGQQWQIQSGLSFSKQVILRVFSGMQRRHGRKLTEFISFQDRKTKLSSILIFCVWVQSFLIRHLILNTDLKGIELSPQTLIF